ncbi:hypothetical protein GQ607_008914 [Colletotrichum asianum]|uniref:Uncharacterized protein n=1 Tax=Colletotrichum asianum TaxID=702518 RepID=A0A8H3WG17_9PEZI|nr:hypothetical protein GQ607_008914 [Colletotrichum asianum]
MSELQPLPPHSEAGLPSSISHSQATPTNPLSDRKGPNLQNHLVQPLERLLEPASDDSCTQTRPRRA